MKKGLKKSLKYNIFLILLFIYFAEYGEKGFFQELGTATFLT